MGHAETFHSSQSLLALIALSKAGSAAYISSSYASEVSTFTAITFMSGKPSSNQVWLVLNRLVKISKAVFTAAPSL